MRGQDGRGEVGHRRLRGERLVTFAAAALHTGSADDAHAAPSGGDAAEDSTVQAALVSVKLRRTLLGKRRLDVRLRAAERVEVLLQLRRGRNSLASKHVDRLRPGLRTLRLLVPPRAPKGKARLRILLEDRAGNGRILTRAVKLPKPRRVEVSRPR